MKITPQRFKFVFTIQTLLIFTDLMINAFSISYKKHHSVVLILFIIQDLCQVLALALLLLSFFSTYVFQAGMVELLYDRFRVTICICILYFILTTIFYIWIMCTQTRDIESFWSYPFTATYIMQRMVSPLYYYFYKRAVLKLSDPRFYDELEWNQPT